MRTAGVPFVSKASDTNQVAAVYDNLATAPWDTSLVEVDVLRIRQWFEDEWRPIAKRCEDRLEESRTLDRQSAQYHDDAAAFAVRAKERSTNGKGSLSHEEEKMGLKQRKKTLDEYQKVLKHRRRDTELARTELQDSLKDKITDVQRLVHDKTAEIAQQLKKQGMPKEEIEEKIAVSRNAVRELTSALVKDFLSA